MIGIQDSVNYRLRNPREVNEFSVPLPVTESDVVGELFRVHRSQSGNLLLTHLLLGLTSDNGVITSKDVRDTIRAVATDDVFLKILDGVIVLNPSITNRVVLTHEVKSVKLNEILVGGEDKSLLWVILLSIVDTDGTDDVIGF